MKTDRLKRMAITLTLCALTSAARGQSMARLTIEPWNGTDLNTSYDHPLVEFGGHANGTQYVTSLSWWDSYGRVRFDRNDPDSPFVAYRIFTMDAGTHDPLRRQLRDIGAVESDVSRGARHQAADRAQRRRFSGAVRAEEGDDLARFDG